MLLPWVVVLAAAAAPVPTSAHADAIARSFASALEADDQAALNRIATGGVADPQRWRDAVGLIGGFDDLRLEATATDTGDDEQAPTLEVELIGTGVTAGGIKETRPVPRRWHLTLANEGDHWLVAAAVTEERRLAERLARATSAEIEAEIASRPELDLHRFLIELGDTASDAVADGTAALDWMAAASRARENPFEISGALQMRSFVAISLGRNDEALRYARESLAVAENAGDAQAASEARFSLGIALWYAGDLPSAVAMLRSAANDLEALTDPRTALRSLYMSGTLAVGSGDVRSALETSLALKRHLQKYPSLRGTMDVSFLLANIYQQLGNVKLAVAESGNALDTAARLGDRDRVGAARMELATVYAGDGDHGRARDVLATVAADDAPLRLGYRVFVHVLLGDEQALLGDLEGADASYVRALAVAHEEDSAEFYSTIEARQAGLRVLQGRAEEAAYLAERAIATAPDETTPALAYLPLAPWIAYTSLGRALVTLGRLEDGEAALRTAIEAAESAETEVAEDPLVPRGPTSDRGEPYRQLIDLLATHGRAIEALEIADRLRARSLLDELERAKVDVSSSLSAEERQREAELDRRVGELNRAVLTATGASSRDRLRTERAQARLEVERFRADLYARHPTLRARRVDVRRETSNDWRSAIPPGGLAVEYLLARDHALAFLVTRGDDGELEVEARRLEHGEAYLTPRIERLKSLIASGDVAFAPTARELHDALLAPLADRLARTHRLAIVPDGPLWRVPFQVLLDAKNRPLVEQVSLFVVPSLGALAKQRAQKPPARASLLAFGNPTISPGTISRLTAARERGPQLGDLPDAEQEVVALRRLYGRERSRLHVGSAARERTFKEVADEFSVLHLATHGLIEDSAPLFSALLLATSPGDGEDGLLEVREVADLSLHASLVVLSACETGGGRLQPGEGVIGLWWAFMVAGAPTIVVSDWNTPSAATRELMVDLHRNLLRGLDPAEALRQAQLARRRDPRHAHPYYWGSFVVVGDGW